MNIIWTRRAENDLIEIGEYISRDKPQAARQLLSMIRTKSKLLQSNPFLGRIVPEYSKMAIREIFVKSFRIVYQVKKTEIFILTVSMWRRLLPDVISEIK